jgi:hypothetical protein
MSELVGMQVPMRWRIFHESPQCPKCLIWVGVWNQTSKRGIKVNKFRDLASCQEKWTSKVFNLRTLIPLPNSRSPNITSHESTMTLNSVDCCWYYSIITFLLRVKRLVSLAAFLVHISRSMDWSWLGYLRN